MDKVYIKGRERINRGNLVSFYELPQDKQENFIKIKNIIEEFETKVDVYIYGSYNHGYWDEFSDYDVIITNLIINNIDEIIFNRLGVKANVIFSEKQLSTILIP